MGGATRPRRGLPKNVISALLPLIQVGSMICVEPLVMAIQASLYVPDRTPARGNKYHVALKTFSERFLERSKNRGGFR